MQASPVPTSSPATSASPAASGGQASGTQNPLTLVATLDPATTGVVRPFALAVGHDGNVYVADLDGTVRVLSPTGQPIRSWSPDGGASAFGNSRADIAIGADGLVYVMEGGNHRVQVFQPDGTFVRQFGSFGSGAGQFLDPIDIAVDASGNVYVADDQPETITKFDPSGTAVWTIGGSGSADANLVGHHHRMAFDSQGRLWISEEECNCVVAVDSDGHEVDAYGQGGTGSGEFQLGTDGIAFDATGNAYVDECADKRLQVFDPQHQVVGVMDAPSGMPFGTWYSFGPDNRLYAIAGSDHCAGGDTAPTGAAGAAIVVYQDNLTTAQP
jgi:sugar lactone lactonase YvrE